MGHTHAVVKLCNKIDTSKCINIRLLIDTGSTYTWINAKRLKEIYVEPTGKRRFKTIEGRIIEREIGEAVIEYMGEKATCIVVFGNEGDAEVLGLTALENLGLEVDPITRELRKVEAILAL